MEGPATQAYNRHRRGGKIQILSGIKAGDQIVVAGNEKLKDGVRYDFQGLKKGETETSRRQR